MRPARTRFAALVLLTALLVTSALAAVPAHACSCAPPSLAELDPAQAVAIALRTDLDGGAEGTIRVLRTVQGPEVVGGVDARFDDGASCDPWLTSGSIGALILTREDGRWRTTGCGQLDLDDTLTATGNALAVDARAGPATLLLAGDLAGAQVATVDAEGRTVALAGGKSRTVGFTTCPEGRVAVLLSDDGDGLHLQRLRLPDLGELGEPVPLDVRDAWQAAAGCQDAAGDRVVVAVPAFPVDGRLLVVDGADVRSTAHPVEAAASGGGVVAVALRGEEGSTLAVADGRGVLTPLHTAGGVTADRVAVSPDGARAVMAGYPDQEPGDVLVSAPTAGGPVATSRREGFHELRWRSDTELVLVDLDGQEGFGGLAARAWVVGADLADPRPVEVGPGTTTALADGGTLHVGYGLLPWVQRGDRATYVASLGLVGAEHAVVLDPAAVLTGPGEAPDPPADAPPTEVQTDEPGAVASPPGDAGTDAWLPVTLGGILLLVGLAVAALVRRRSGDDLR